MGDDPGISCLRLSDSVAKTGTLCLNQQLWLWGQDIVRPGRNLLIEYGFDRHPDGAGAARSTCYTASHASGVCIALWSWGVFFGEAARGGLFVRRAAIQPFLTPTATLPPLHWPEGMMPKHRAPQTESEGETARQLLLRLVRWIAAYEDWMTGVADLGYREACLRDWRQPVGEARTLPDLWRGMAKEIESESEIVVLQSA